MWRRKDSKREWRLIIFAASRSRETGYWFKYLFEVIFLIVFCYYCNYIAYSVTTHYHFSNLQYSILFHDLSLDLSTRFYLHHHQSFQSFRYLLRLVLKKNKRKFSFYYVWAQRLVGNESLATTLVFFVS